MTLRFYFLPIAYSFCLNLKMKVLVACVTKQTCITWYLISEYMLDVAFLMNSEWEKC